MQCGYNLLHPLLKPGKLRLVCINVIFDSLGPNRSLYGQFTF